MEARSRMTAAGYILIGLAIGVVLGALSAYGGMFAWAIRYGNNEEE
jgi:hypothetical protein